MKNKALLSLGANSSNKHSILRAVTKEISQQTHVVACTPIYDTPAEGSMTHIAPYANALMIIETDQDYDTLHRTCKEREKAAGRTAQSKQLGIIPLDIDIVEWNGRILKEHDMEYDYMKKGLKLLMPTE